MSPNPPPHPRHISGIASNSRCSPAWFAPLALALAFSAHSATCRATSITLQGGFGYPNAKDSAGLPLEPGHKVSIGTFPDGFDPSTADLPAILANWRQFHFTTTETIDGDAGSFWLKHASPTGTNPEGFSFPGKKIHLLLTRTDAAYAEPAADGSNVRDYALFTSSDPAWTFRPPASESNLPPGDLSSLNTSQINSALAGTADPATGTFALATYSSAGSADGGGAEPSAFEQWLNATFGENSGVSAESAIGPAGLTALATYALASSPQATATPYTTINDGNGRIGIEFTRKKASVSGLDTFAQASTDLSDWSLSLTPPAIAEVDGDPDAEKVTVFPVEPTDKAFFRIRVQPANQN